MKIMLLKVIDLMKERVKSLNDMQEMTDISLQIQLIMMKKLLRKNGKMNL